MATTDGSERLRGFLLGELSEPERIEVEERLLTDEEFFQELLLLEDDLVDEYVFGELPEAQRRRLEQRFALFPDRLEAIRLAGLLRQQGRTASTRRKRLGGQAWPAAAAVALLALSGALIAHRQRTGALERALQEARTQEQDSRRDAAARERGLQSRNEALARELAEERARAASANPPAVTPRPRAVKTPQPPVAGPLMATLALSPGSLRSRSDLPTLKAPGPSGRVRLFLTLEEEGDEQYALDLLGDADTRLWSAADLRSSGGLVVIVDVPSRLLEPGQYRVVLRRPREGREPETVATYPFRVARGD